MSEPVRTYLYPVLIAVVALLVGYGILEQEQGALWIGLGAALSRRPLPPPGLRRCTFQVSRPASWTLRPNIQTVMVGAR